jgi:hypothetical protein
MAKIHLIILLALIGLSLRLLYLSSTPFVSDQDWFYYQAVASLRTGNFSLLGISTSITWLHQGPLWTYLLIPGLVISNFHPLSGTIFTIVLSVLTVLLIFFWCTSVFNRQTGIISAALVALCPFAIFSSRMSYHTSVIPLFTAIFLLLLSRKQALLAGLFWGFLYQLHLLTFVFWPIVAIYIFKKNIHLFIFILGFVVGIFPFIISGPVQTLGIFVWLVKFLITGAHSSGLSAAYHMVFFIPLVIIISVVLSRLPRFVSYVVLLIIFMLNLFVLHPVTPSLSQAFANTSCSTSASTYLYWWKCEHN